MSEIETTGTAGTAQESPEPARAERPRRKRTGRKRSRFSVPPRPARPVRALWEQASQEERERAHATCMQVLEYWLGKKSKQQVASELGVPALRVWQLSQQALSGMLARLPKQPRTRGKLPLPEEEATPGHDPKVLRRRIVELEKSLSRTEDLVRVLRTPVGERPLGVDSEGQDSPCEDQAGLQGPRDEGTIARRGSRSQRSSERGRTARPRWWRWLTRRA